MLASDREGDLVCLLNELTRLIVVLTHRLNPDYSHPDTLVLRCGDAFPQVLIS